jgi:hypothetical protein
MAIEIQPASLGQVKRSSRGQLVEITQDVTDVAKQLRDIDPDLHLLFNDEQGFYIVQHHVHEPDGSVTEHVVLTAKQLGSNIVDRVRQISSDGYDYVRELEQMENQARRDREHAEREARGPILEELAHALRKDLGLRPWH